MIAPHPLYPFYRKKHGLRSRKTRTAALNCARGKKLSFSLSFRNLDNSHNKIPSCFFLTYVCLPFPTKIRICIYYKIYTRLLSSV